MDNYKGKESLSRVVVRLMYWHKIELMEELSNNKSLLTLVKIAVMQ